jgi:Uma2 family endonuclease
MAAAPDVTTPKLMTAEELIRLSTGMGKRYELVHGELKTMSPAGFKHGRIAMKIGARLQTHASSRGLGSVAAAETGYRLRNNPDTVRAPDVSFVSKARLDKIGEVTAFFPGAPDLAVEVVSPDDTATEVKIKVSEYFEAGGKLVWIIYPDTREVVVFRSARESTVLSSQDTLDGGEVIPGFTCRVAELFE